MWDVIMDELQCHCYFPTVPASILVWMVLLADNRS